MARRGSQVPYIAQIATPIALGLLFLAYLFEALFTPFSAGVTGAFAGLTIISLLLTVAFAGLLVASQVSQSGYPRIWINLLVANVAIWIVGTILHFFLPRAV